MQFLERSPEELFKRIFVTCGDTIEFQSDRFSDLLLLLLFVVVEKRKESQKNKRREAKEQTSKGIGSSAVIGFKSRYLTMYFSTSTVLTLIEEARVEAVGIRGSSI